MDPLVVFQNIGFFTVASLIVGAFIRSMFKLFMDKDLENFKTKLEQETIRFSKLHEDRAYAIRELISKLVKFKFVMRKLTSPLQSDDETEVFKEAKRVANEYLYFNNENRIYFNPKVCELLDVIDERGKDAWSAWLLSKDNAHKHLEIDNWQKAWKNVGVIDDLIKELEEEFRVILGVTKENH